MDLEKNNFKILEFEWNEVTYPLITFLIKFKYTKDISNICKYIVFNNGSGYRNIEQLLKIDESYLNSAIIMNEVLVNSKVTKMLNYVDGSAKNFKTKISEIIIPFDTTDKARMNATSIAEKGISFSKNIYVVSAILNMYEIVTLMLGNEEHVNDVLLENFANSAHSAAGHAAAAVTYIDCDKEKKSFAELSYDMAGIDLNNKNYIDATIRYLVATLLFLSLID